MPSLNFRKEFVEKIKLGLKTQTIRAPRKNGKNPKPGDILYLYTGQRTKHCEKIRNAICLSCEPIVIEEKNIFIDAKSLNYQEKWKLSENDGFGSLDDFREFFNKAYGLPFTGYIIKWA